MAITIDTTTTPSSRVNAWTTMTVSHTCTWTDRAIVVNVGTDWNKVSWVTYAWVSLTVVWSYTADGSGNWTTCWVLANPASWANNVVITTSVSATIMCEIVSYTWVNQWSPVWSSITNWPISTGAFAQVVTTGTNNSWLVMCWKGRSWNAITAGSNTYIRVNIELLFTWLFIADSNAAQTPTGSYTLNISSAAQEFNGNMFELKPSATSTVNSSFLAFM